MGPSFDDILAECLESVAQGQRTIEACLALYPDSAELLEPALRLGLQLRHTYRSHGPEASFQSEARQRFLSAVEARGAAPAAPPSWRERLSTAVTSVRLRLRPSVVVARPALAALAIVFITFAGFSSYVMATAGDTLPGDWRYPAKRLGEQVRLSFTFSDEDKRDVRIGITQERLWELQRMAAQGKPIGDSILRELAHNTDSLVKDLESTSVPPQQIERISDLTAQQQDVLDEVGPLVTDDATDDLDMAKQVSTDGHERAVFALEVAGSEDDTLALVGTATANAGASATPGTTGTPGASGTPAAGAAAGTPATGTPSPDTTPTPEASEEPGAPEATPTPAGASEESTPQPTPEATATPTPPALEMVALPDDSTGGITWSLLTVGSFSVRVPAPEENAWVVSDLRPQQEREVIFVGHRWGNRFDAVITIRVATGQASVSSLVQGTLLATDLEDVPQALPSLSDIILHIAGSASTSP